MGHLSTCLHFTSTESFPILSPQFCAGFCIPPVQEAIPPYWKTRFVLLLPILSMGHTKRLFAGDGAYPYRFPAQPHGNDIRAITLIGSPQTYVVQENDTLLDIARNFDLGFSEITLLYKDLDPWIPPPGLELTIPTFWILPEGNWNGILIVPDWNRSH